MRRILKAAIKIDGKVYTGRHHTDAIAKAVAEGKDTSKIDRERDGLFLVQDGFKTSLITRNQAEKEFKIRHSEDIDQQVTKGRKFCIVTKDFSSLGFALDYRNKNDEIIFATNPDIKKLKQNKDEEKYDKIGENLITRFDLSDVMNRRNKMRDFYFVFDGNHSVEENEILRKESFKVCLGSELTYKMENDRAFGIELSEQLGIESPLWEDFKEGKQGIELLKQYPDDAFFMKPNAQDESHLTTPPVGKDSKKANEYLQKWLETLVFKEGFVLQKTVKGTEVNLEYFCVNGEIKSAQINLEVKRISEASLIDAYEKGSLCGCAYDVCKNIDINSPIVEMTIGKLKTFIKEKKHTGFADMNFIIGENEMWFIEWCWRTGYNAHPNYFMNVSNKDYLNTIADMHDGIYELDAKRGWGASVTLYTDHPAEGVPIIIQDSVKNKVYLFDGYKQDDTLFETGISNEIAIVGGYGDTIQKAMSDAYDNISKVAVAKSDYRSDGLKEDFNSSPIQRYRALEQFKYL